MATTAPKSSGAEAPETICAVSDQSTRVSSTTISVLATAIRTNLPAEKVLAPSAASWFVVWATRAPFRAIDQTPYV